MPNTQAQGKVDLLRLLGAEVYPVPAVAFENPENYNHQARRHAERLGEGKAVEAFLEGVKKTVEEEDGKEAEGPSGTMDTS